LLGVPTEEAEGMDQNALDELLSGSNR
jgi:hypothetical protein